MTRLSFCGYLWVVHRTSTLRSLLHPQRLWETNDSRFEQPPTQQDAEAIEPQDRTSEASTSPDTDDDPVELLD